MTINDKLLEFHLEIRPKLKVVALRLANGCPDAAEDILAEAQLQHYPALKSDGMVGWCLLKAARTQRRAAGGGRRLEADWGAWAGDVDGEDGEKQGPKHWQASPLADHSFEQQLALSARRESVDKLFARLADTQEQAFWAAIKAGVERPEAAKQAGLTQVQVTRLIARLRATIRVEDAA